jgi:hypothetical protein
LATNQTGRALSCRAPSSSFRSGDKEADLLRASNVNDAALLRPPPRAGE